MSNAEIIRRERCWKGREAGGLKFQLMTNNESVFVSAEGHQKFCALLSLTSFWVWYSTWKGFFLPSQIFFFPSTFTFFFSWGHKRKVDLFQIPHSPGIFAFCSMALNTENVFLQMVWSSNPQNTGWNFEGFCGWNVPAVLVEAIEVVTEPPSREAALSCCHFSHCFTGVGEAKHC